MKLLFLGWKQLLSAMWKVQTTCCISKSLQISTILKWVTVWLNVGTLFCSQLSISKIGRTVEAAFVWVNGIAFLTLYLKRKGTFEEIRNSFRGNLHSTFVVVHFAILQGTFMPRRQPLARGVPTGGVGSGTTPHF